MQCYYFFHNLQTPKAYPGYMIQYLLDYLKYNDRANKQLLQTILTLPDKAEAMRLFSHIIYAQNKWYNRVTKERNDNDYDWSGPAFSELEAAQQWDNSYRQWEALLTAMDTDVEQYVYFTRKADGKLMKVKLRDIIFQINCHSVHHRAQINKLISSQGIAVPLTDYIFSAISEAE